MKNFRESTDKSSKRRRVAFSSLAVAMGFVISLAGIGQANAAGPTTVLLGAAESFAVVGHTTVTNTGPSVIAGDLGLSPGSAVTGFPPGVMTTGNIHISDGSAGDAAMALNTAYLDAAGRTPPTNPVPYSDLAGLTLTGGLYQGGALANTGMLTLDGGGDSTSTWIFQASSTLITDAGSQVLLIGEADPCNVFWQVSTSTTLGTNSTMVGTVMTLQSISATTGASVNGRLLALNGAVTLDSSTITVPATCAGTITPGGTKTSPAATPPVGAVSPSGPTLAASGSDVGLPLVAILTLMGGGVALLMMSGNNSRKLREKQVRK